MNAPHWTISVQDAINGNKEIHAGYFDGTYIDAQLHFRGNKPWSKYFGDTRYVILMSNCSVLQDKNGMY